MNISRLRKRGWSEEEIEHLLSIIDKAEANKHPRLKLLEHVAFWLVIISLMIGSVGVSLELLPFILLSSFSFTLPIVFVFGALFGLLLVHALHDLKMELGHQHAGVIILLFSSVFIITFLLNSLQQRLGIISSTGSMALGLIFALGITIPYLVHWRITHETA